MGIADIGFGFRRNGLGLLQPRRPCTEEKEKDRSAILDMSGWSYLYGKFHTCSGSMGRYNFIFLLGFPGVSILSLSIYFSWNFYSYSQLPRVYHRGVRWSPS